MGNALTAASVSAADVIVPISQQIAKPESHRTKEYHGKPPSECPMHKLDQLNTIDYVSECPIDKMDESQINPLNMVPSDTETFYAMISDDTCEVVRFTLFSF